MSRKFVSKILAVFGVLVSAISLKANQGEVNYLKQDDLQKIQDLVDRKVLTITDEGLKLNEELNESNLINILDSSKSSNCIGGNCI